MKSLDLQMLLPKSTEIAKSRHLEQKGPETTQQQFALETRRQAVTQGRTVRRAEGTRGGKISRDGRRGGSAGSDGSGNPEGGSKGSQAAAATAGSAIADHESRSDRDGKGKFIDIVLGATGNWGDR